MILTARSIALQGFLLSPIAMAVQGLFSGDVLVEPVAPVAPVQRRQAVVGSGPGTQINYSDYIKRIKGGNAMLQNPAPLPIQEQPKHARIARQRKQHRIVALASAVL